MKLDDDSKIPVGAFKGTVMANVPGWYLLWAYDNPNTRNSPNWSEVMAYIKDNREVLELEVYGAKNK